MRRIFVPDDSAARSIGEQIAVQHTSSSDAPRAIRLPTDVQRRADRRHRERQRLRSRTVRFFRLDGDDLTAVRRNRWRRRATEAERQRLVDALYERGSALNAASLLEFDAVIDPAETRETITRALRTAGPTRPGPRYADAW